MSDRFVTVHRTYDPIQADILGDILRENGIAARVLGTRSAASIGVGDAILQRHIEVPAAQAGEATDFIEAFLEGDGAQLLRDEAGLDLDDDDGDAQDSEAPDDDDERRHEFTRRSPFMAGVSTLLFFGSHFYAQRPWTGAFLLAGQFIAYLNIARGMAADAWTPVASGLTTLAILLVFDFVGGQVAVRSYNRGFRASRVRQWVLGGAVVATAGIAGSALGPHIPDPRSQREPAYTPYFELGMPASGEPGEQLWVPDLAPESHAPAE